MAHGPTLLASLGSVLHLQIHGPHTSESGPGGGVGPRNPHQALLGILTPTSENHWVRPLGWDGHW